MKFKGTRSMPTTFSRKRRRTNRRDSGSLLRHHRIASVATAGSLATTPCWQAGATTASHAAGLPELHQNVATSSRSTVGTFNLVPHFRTVYPTRSARCGTVYRCHSDPCWARLRPKPGARLPTRGRSWCPRSPLRDVRQQDGARRREIRGRRRSMQRRRDLRSRFRPGVSVDQEEAGKLTVGDAFSGGCRIPRIAL